MTWPPHLQFTSYTTALQPQHSFKYHGNDSILEVIGEQTESTLALLPPLLSYSSPHCCCHWKSSLWVVSVLVITIEEVDWLSANGPRKQSIYLIGPPCSVLPEQLTIYVYLGQLTAILCVQLGAGKSKAPFKLGIHSLDYTRSKKNSPKNKKDLGMACHTIPPLKKAKKQGEMSLPASVPSH